MAWLLRNRGPFNTGWVDVPVQTGEGYLLDGTGTVQVRRSGIAPDLDWIDIRMTGVGVLNTVTNAAYLTPAGFLPPGFRCWYFERESHEIGQASGSNGGIRLSVMQGTRLRLASGSVLPGPGGLAMQGTFTVRADGARP